MSSCQSALLWVIIICDNHLCLFSLLSRKVHFLVKVSLRCSKLCDMICRQNGINSNIWFDNATHKIHLSDAIDSILEDEKLWIAFAEKLREPFEKDCYPLQRVSASRTSLDDRERKSELAIVVSLRCIKICLLLLQKLSDKMPGGCFAD